MPRYRPEIHLAPRKGWMNDPNGFSLDPRGGYRLFYQHHDALEGDVLIDWALAESDDLVHFEDKGTALLPTAPEEGVGKDPLWGGCWSGSAFEHEGRTHLLYTACSRDGERQAIAVRSEDGLFRMDRSLGLLKEPDGIPTEFFRDPFAFSTMEGDFVLLGARLPSGEGGVLLYRREGTALSYEGVFFSLPGSHMIECPGIFFLEEKAVLVLSPMGLDERKWGPHPSCYLAGRLEDGMRFVPEGEPALLDHGYDYYAAQPLQEGKGAHIAAWLSLWDKDLGSVPSKEEGFVGTMGLVRNLSIKNGALFQEWEPSLLGYFEKERRFDGDFLKFEDAPLSMFSLSSDVSFEARLLGGEKDGLRLSYDASSGMLRMDAHDSEHVRAGLNLVYPGVREAKALPGEEIRVFVDHSVVEVVLGGGRIWMSSLFYPSTDHPVHEFSGRGLSLSFARGKAPQIIS